MNLQSILANPDHFLHSFNQADAVMVEMDRDTYGQSIFLDQRILAKGPVSTKVPRASLLQGLAAAPAAAPICYIFHTAHCGSTLLARALDLKTENLVLREPQALRQLGVEAATTRGADHERTVRLVRTLLARRYNPNGPVIVKANVPVNFLIPDLMAPQANQPAIFLHYGLDDYLLAILRSETHRGWVQRVVGQLSPGLDRLTGAQTAEQSVAVLAAHLWLAQVLMFDRALGDYPNTRSLSAEDLFEKPAAVVSAAFELFGQSQSTEVIAKIVGSEMFQRYSKDPRYAFNNALRVQRRAALKVELASDLKQARDWVLSTPASQQLPERLARPLGGDGCALLG